MAYMIFMTDAEKRLLEKSVSLVPEKNRDLPCIEIGCAVGGSTAVIAEAMQSIKMTSRLIAIDPCRFDTEWVTRKTNGQESSHAGAIRTSVAPFGDRVELRVSESAAERGRWKEGPIAWLLIDGDHSLKAAKDDLNWADFLAPGGVLLLHDVGWKCGWVAVALRDWWDTRAAEWFWWSQVGSLIVLHRRK